MIKYLAVWLIAGCLALLPSCSPVLQTSGGPANTSSSSGTMINTGNYTAIADFFFSPSTLTVASNTTVHWTNTGSAPHTVTSVLGQSYNSGNMANGAGFMVTFIQPGTNMYHCTIHPGMTGKVVVTN